MKKEFIILFILLNISIFSAFNSKAEEDCKKIIYNSIKQNMTRIEPNQDFFDRVDSLPVSTKKLLHFARLQKINGEIYYQMNDDISKRPWLINKIKLIANFIKEHNKEIGDLDIVLNLFDENRALPVTNFNNLYYSGPIFTTSYSKSDLNLYEGNNQFILHPDYYVLDKNFKKIPSEVKSSLPFNKKIDKAFFRGGNHCGAGGEVFEHEVTEQNMHPRPKIFILSFLFPDYIDAKTTRFEFNNKIEGDQLKVLRLYKALFENAETHYVPISEQNKYKYLVSLDGEAASWSRPQIISFSGSLLLYQTDYKQWFQDAMKPYYNYIPIKSDLSNLLTQIDWARDNPDKAEKIVNNQLSTAKACFTREEAEKQLLYMLQLYSKKFTYKITKKNFMNFNTLSAKDK
jgi:hypothetical protein